MGRRKKTAADDENGFGQWGGYMEAKRMKLMEQFKDQVEKQVEKRSDIFKGIAILVNGHTKPSAEELKLLMAEHGGAYHMYQVSTTTHIIASNLPNVKINKLGNIPIVKPGWIEDSITLGRLLDYSNYLLYTNQSRTQPRLNFKVVPKSDTSSEENLETQIAAPVESSTSKPSAKTASDPKFLAEFYNNSRLHLISTLGAEFKQLVNDLREKSDGKFPGIERLLSCKGTSSGENFVLFTYKVIMHIDMDCFFVSVGLRSRPELLGKPVAVTHSKGGQSNREDVDRQKEISMYQKRLPEGVESRLTEIDNSSSLSEIASCSYEARKCGIKNGMFMGAALKLCPELKTIPYDFQGYREVSNILYRTIAEYTLDIEAVSCDEMYVDVSKILQKAQISVADWAAHIRAEITSRTGCPCSTGFGGNRLQARLATKKAKPNGSFYLRPEDVDEYMKEIPLGDLPGVGWATMSKLKTLGLIKCGDVQFMSAAVLKNDLGSKVAESIMEQARGEDKRPLRYDHERKSVSAEINYGIRFKSESEAHGFLESLSVEVCTRLRDLGMKARCVTLKLMVRAEEAPVETAKYLGHGVCDSLSRNVTLLSGTGDPAIIFKEAKILYDRLNLKFADMRGMGIQLSKLEKAGAINKVLKNFLAKATSPKKAVPVIENPIDDLNKENTVSTYLTNQDLAINEVAKDETSLVRKRGRPKGSKNCTNTTLKKKPSSQDLSMYFKSTVKDRPSSSSTKTSSNINLEILKELPEDIRNEVIKEYQLNVNKPKPLQKVTNQPADGISLTATKTSGISKIKKRLKKEQKTQGFETMSNEDFKSMLKTWLDSRCGPLDVDINMLAKYFKQLAIDGEIVKLQRMLRFFHRHVAITKNCKWHEAYIKLANYSQEGMKLRYQGVLSVPGGFDCDQHK